MYDFIDVIAMISCQLRQDNQLLLVLHDETLELQSSTGRKAIEESRSLWKQKEEEKNREYMTMLLENYCARLSADEEDDFLRVGKRIK